MIGSLLQRYETIVNLVTGGVVIILGLNFTGIVNIGFLNGSKKAEMEFEKISFGSSVLFGIVFSIGWTPCVGAFLGSALMMASQQGTVAAGIWMLILYSAGLGIPFVISALLLDRLKDAFQLIKKNYRMINLLSGIFLIIVGIMMATGTFGYLLALFSA